MLKKLKVLSGVALAAGLALGATVTPVLAADGDDYSGKTVILYSGNLRGDVDDYAKLAAAKKDYQAKGATVYLVDAGNYLQGSTYANTDRGLGIYNLMDAAGYDVVGMGPYDFVHADATTGISYHGNLHRFYTQAELKNGADELEYSLGPRTTATDIRAAKSPATFSVIASNMEIASENTGYYSFQKNTNRSNGTLNVGFIGISDPDTPEIMQDDYMLGYNFTDTVTRPSADIIVCLDSSETVEVEADIGIEVGVDASKLVGAFVIDDQTKEVTPEEVNLDSYQADAAVAQLAESIKNNAQDVIAKSDVTFVGADRIGWRSETNLGDFVSDALVWYAKNKISEFKDDVPLVGIINGGNCDQFIYTGDITEVDLLRGLPFSPMGVGIVYLTGEQLLETIEASQNMNNARYDDERCPGFAQVSGMEYVIDTTADFDEGEAYGNFYRPDSINVVTIKSVNGQPFDPEATYAVVADNMIMNGGDTYATIGEVVQAVKDGGEGTYINNGNGVLTRHIVQMYIEEELGGEISGQYAEPQGRIKYCEGHAHKETINSVEATCTTEGYTGDIHCLDCDTILEYGSVIPKLSETGEHSPGEPVITKEATCTEAGIQEIHCSVCNALLSTEEIEATGHEWIVDAETDADGWKIITEATATTDGLAERTCSKDGFKETKVISKSGEVETLNGWVRTDDGYKYYSEDIAYTGWHWMTEKEGETTPHWSYFTNDGILVEGWKYFTEADGESTPHWSYFGSNGWLRTGWKWLGEADGEKTPHWSYFGSNGWLRTGWQRLGEADGESTPHWSYFGANGWLRTGWQWLTSADGEKTPHWSYFGSNGWLRTGWQRLGEADGEKTPHWSYFGSNGWLRTGWHYLGEADGEKTPHWSYFGSNGWLRTGWVDLGRGTSEPDGNSATHRSYFGDNGWLRTGRQTIDGRTYNFDSRGWLR